MLEIRIPNSFEVAMARQFGARNPASSILEVGILVVALLALGWLVARVATAAGEEEENWIILVVVALFALRQGGGMLPATRRIAARRLDARMTGELVYRIDDDGISCSGPAGNSSIRWASRPRAGRRDGCIVLQDGQSIVAIPVAALDADARERLRAGIGADRWDRLVPGGG